MTFGIQQVSAQMASAERIERERCYREQMLMAQDGIGEVLKHATDLGAIVERSPKQGHGWRSLSHYILHPVDAKLARLRAKREGFQPNDFGLAWTERNVLRISDHPFPSPGQWEGETVILPDSSPERVNEAKARATAWYEAREAAIRESKGVESRRESVHHHLRVRWFQSSPDAWEGFATFRDVWSNISIGTVVRRGANRKYLGEYAAGGSRGGRTLTQAKNDVAKAARKRLLQQLEGLPA